MITTTKQEIRKAVIEALKSEQYYADLYLGQSESIGEWIVDQDDYSSVADLVADKLGETEGPQWILESHKVKSP